MIRSLSLLSIARKLPGRHLLITSSPNAIGKFCRWRPGRHDCEVRRKIHLQCTMLLMQRDVIKHVRCCLVGADSQRHFPTQVMQHDGILLAHAFKQCYGDKPIKRTPPSHFQKPWDGLILMTESSCLS